MYSMMTIVDNTVLNTGNFLKEQISSAPIIKKGYHYVGDNVLNRWKVVIILLFICVSVHHVIHLKYVQLKNLPF